MMSWEKSELKKIVKEIPKEDLKCSIYGLYKKYCDASLTTCGTFRKYLIAFRGEELEAIKKPKENG